MILFNILIKYFNKNFIKENKKFKIIYLIKTYTYITK